MTTCDPELLKTEKKLLAIRKKLQSLPKNNEDLLALLEEVESVLSEFYLELPESTLKTVHQVAAALADDKLVGNKDPKIILQLAACYNDLIRLTPPDGPYPYEMMKECYLFFLYVFKYLCGEPEKEYRKAMRILVTMAEMKTIMILTDLEDHEPVVAVIFRRFFSVVRFNQHPFMIKCMEVVMTTAIQNIWELSMDILKPLLDSVEKGNKHIAPASRELGMRVLKKNAHKVRYWIKEAHERTRLPVDNYDEIVGRLLLLADAAPRELPMDIPNELTDEDWLGCDVVEKPRGKYEPPDDVEGDDDATPDVQSKTNPEEEHNNEKEEEHNNEKEEEHNNEINKGGILRVRSKLRRRGKKKPMSIPHSNGFCFEMVQNMQARLGMLEIKDGMITEREEAKNTAAKVKGSKKKKPKKGSAKEKEKNSRQAPGKELVNMRVKVWWPLDNTFYTGTILSYDASTKKHKVLYDDDEEEILDLNDQIWEPFHEERILLDNGTSSSSASSRGDDQDSEIVFESRLASSSTSSCMQCLCPQCQI